MSVFWGLKFWTPGGFAWSPMKLLGNDIWSRRVVKTMVLVWPDLRLFERNNSDAFHGLFWLFCFWPFCLEYIPLSIAGLSLNDHLPTRNTCLGPLFSPLPSLPSHFPSFPSPPLPWRGVGIERCKLPQRVRRSPPAKRFLLRCGFKRKQFLSLIHLVYLDHRCSKKTTADEYV